MQLEQNPAKTSGRARLIKRVAGAAAALKGIAMKSKQAASKAAGAARRGTAKAFGSIAAAGKPKRGRRSSEEQEAVEGPSGGPSSTAAMARPKRGRCGFEEEVAVEGPSSSSEEQAAVVSYPHVCGRVRVGSAGGSRLRQVSLRLWARY